MRFPPSYTLHAINVFPFIISHLCNCNCWTGENEVAKNLNKSHKSQKKVY